MTTDKFPKYLSQTYKIGQKKITFRGICKGAGMIEPNMATMLAFVSTDATVSPQLLQSICREVAEVSFNRITVDGDTSTNDAFVLTATGAHQDREIFSGSEGCRELTEAIILVCKELAKESFQTVTFFEDKRPGSTPIASRLCVLRLSMSLAERRYLCMQISSSKCFSCLWSPVIVLQTTQMFFADWSSDVYFSPLSYPL